MTSEKKTFILSITTLLIAMISIQGGAALAKQLFPLIGAEGTSVIRLVFAAAILCGIWRPWRTRLQGREWKSIFAYGAALGLMNLTFYISIARIPLGIAVALEFTGPLGVALLASRKPIDFLWAALATLGIILILPISPAENALDPIGILFALTAGMCWAGYILFGQKAGTSTHAGVVTSLGMAVAALVALPVGIASAGTSLFTFSILPIGILMAILSSALPYSLEMISLKNMPAKNFGILMSLEPVFAALSGLIFLSEHLSLIQWFAIVSIMLASIGSSASIGRSAQPEP